MSNEPGYEPRYCAFVDILGFRELIHKLHGDPNRYLELKRVLAQLHTPPSAGRDVILRGCDLRAQSISDAVAISAAVNAAGLLHLFFLLEHVATNFLAQGLLIRGAVVKGNLYHDKDLVFGEALVYAYHLESEVVRYPRIMIASDVARDVNRYLTEESKQREHFVGALRQADDGPMYLHVLRFMIDALAKEVDRTSHSGDSLGASPMVEFYCQMGSELQRRLELSIDYPRHFEKVKWFAAYWNAVVPRGIPGLNPIRGAGLPAPEL
jgi:hypothetical protein